MSDPQRAATAAPPASAGRSRRLRLELGLKAFQDTHDAQAALVVGDRLAS
ncbi:MAG: hypothetical protein JO304_15205 [Solirubrobacterales bacterium]|nr:hypothetical protein [Solirubrobacterales bacterium]